MIKRIISPKNGKEMAMILKVFDKLNKGDQKEHSELISNLTDDEFREYLDTIQSVVEDRTTEETDPLEEESGLEELFDKIDIIASQLEDGGISLEESFALYNKGLNLLKESNNIIDEIEKKVLVLDSKGDTYEL
jgi:exodeoxyribonuclease VII small subunit